MTIFNWDDLRHADHDPQPTREATIVRAFHQHVSGNDYFDDMNTLEIRSAFGEFRTGWLICELMQNRQS